jgi:hypothetical protein
MQKPKLDTYFEKKGINVRFNTLGNDETLVRTFVSNFQSLVDLSKLKQSNHVKLSCYSNMYTFEPRTKHTGFELLQPLEKSFREKINFFVKDPQFSPLLLIEKSDNKIITENYKDVLKNDLQKIENILVYYSGGLDSELVCNSLIESGKKFTPVIFQWTNNNDIINQHDLNYAFKFCKEKNLKPIIKTVNLETLWNSQEFEKLAIDTGIVSPQIVTYAYIIELMSKEIPNATHLFGGEVRFRSDYMVDNGDFANLVYLNKVSPLGYEGLTYTDASAGIAFISLYYYDDGTWAVVGQSGVQATGTWTTTPATTYEMKTDIDLTPGTYQTITGPTYIAADIQNFSPPSDITVQFTMSVRVVGQTTPVVVSTIILQAVAI